MAIQPRFGDLPEEYYPPEQDPRTGVLPIGTVDFADVFNNRPGPSTDPDPDPSDGTEKDGLKPPFQIASDGLESGQLSEQQAEAFLDAYMAILESLSGFEGSLGINLNEKLKVLASTLNSNPDAVISQMEELVTEVRLVHTRLIEERQFDADQTQQLFNNELALKELERQERATDVTEAISLRSSRMQQAQMEQMDARANLASFQEAARLQEQLASGAMGARQDFWGSLVGRTGGLPYMGAAGPSPSGAGVYDIAQSIGAQGVAPYEMTGGPIEFPDLTQTPEFQRALEIQDELSRREIETPVVETAVAQSDLSFPRNAI
jgi:hypothetical protein